MQMVLLEKTEKITTFRLADCKNFCQLLLKIAKEHPGNINLPKISQC